MCAAVVFLQGCGGGSGGNVAVTGQAIKGPVVGAQVCAYTMATPRVLIACTATDASSSYKLDLSTDMGEVLLETTGGSYVDEATGVTVALTIPLRTVARVDNTTAHTLMTPFTELAVQNVLLAAPADPLTFAGFQTQIEAIERGLGLTGLTTARPFGGTSANDLAHKEALTAFSRYQDRSGKTVADIIRSLATIVGRCGPYSMGAVLAYMGPPGEWDLSQLAGEVDLAASDLTVDNNGCLLPVVPGTGFAGITAVRRPSTSGPGGGGVVIGNANVTSGSGGQLPIGPITSWRSFEIGSDLASLYVRPGSSTAVLNIAHGSASVRDVSGVVAPNAPVVVVGGQLSLGGPGALVLTGAGTPEAVLSLTAGP